MNHVFLWILYSSIMATLIMIFILFIKKVFKNFISFRLSYALWFLVLIKLFVPFTFESPISLFNFLPNVDNHILSPQEIEHNIYSIDSKQLINNEYYGDATKKHSNISNIRGVESQSNLFKNKKLDSYDIESNLNKKTSFQKYISIGSYIWFSGILVMTLFVSVILVNFHGKTKFVKKIENPEVIGLVNYHSKKLDINRRIFLYYDNKMSSPFIHGFFRPKIFLPENILSIIDHNKLSYIILHELSHYKRKDTLLNFISLIAIVLHWFNPIIWWGMKLMKEEREILCDKYALENLNEDEATLYGKTIIKLSSAFSFSKSKNLLVSNFFEATNILERRIVMIKKFKKGSYKLSAITIGGLIFMSSITLTNAESLEYYNNNTSNINYVKEDISNFKIDSTYKRFNDLERAMDFIDYKFKVPNYIPSGFKFYKVDLMDGRPISLRFENKHNATFNFLISKENIISLLELPKSNFENNKQIISSSNGRNHFIWQDDGIWYGIEYYSKEYLLQKNKILNNISMEDISNIASSLKEPRNINTVDYVSQPYKNFLCLYDHKDIEKAKEILGFSPNLPVNLSNNFKAVSSRTSKLYYDDLNHPGMELETVYQKKSDNSLPKIEFVQGNNTYAYDRLLKDDSYKKQEKGSSILTIDGLRILATEKLNKEGIKKQKYIWKKGGIYNEINITGKINNIDEIIKSLIK